MKTFIFHSKSERQTRSLAKRLGRALRKGDCLALEGEFGAGKTVFVKGVVGGLNPGKKDYVCSPSFVILKTYQGRLPVYHFDLYRLAQGDFQDIGLSEFIEGEGVAVIEWAQKAKGFLPEAALRVKFFVLGPQERKITMTATAARWRRFLEALE